MNRHSMLCLLMPAALTIAGCQPRPATDAAPVPLLGPIVGRDELLTSGRPWLLDALRVVRPTYFLSRGQATLVEQQLVPMVVVIDGMVIPDIESLRSTPVADVVQVRRLTPSETYHRYNRSVSVGALEIVLRKQR